MDVIERFYTDLRVVDDEAPGRQTEKSATDFVNIFQKFKLAFNLMVCGFYFIVPFSPSFFEYLLFLGKARRVFRKSICWRNGTPPFPTFGLHRRRLL